MVKFIKTTFFFVLCCANVSASELSPRSSDDDYTAISYGDLSGQASNADALTTVCVKALATFEKGIRWAGSVPTTVAQQTTTISRLLSYKTCPEIFQDLDKAQQIALLNNTLDALIKKNNSSKKQRISEKRRHEAEEVLYFAKESAVYDELSHDFKRQVKQIVRRSYQKTADDRKSFNNDFSDSENSDDGSQFGAKRLPISSNERTFTTAQPDTQPPPAQQ